MGEHPYLYYVRLANKGQGRVFFRQGITLTLKKGPERCGRVVPPAAKAGTKNKAFGAAVNRCATQEQGLSFPANCQVFVQLPLPARMRGSGFGGVEVIVGGVTAFCFCVLVSLVAAGSGRLASVRMQALNRRHLREQTLSVSMADGIPHQPGN